MVSNKPPHHHQQLRLLHKLPDLFSTVFSLFFLFTAKPHHTLSIKPLSLSFPRNPNRRPLFLKPPTMFSFSTPESLSEWLKPRLPSASFASWGVKPGTKNVHNLWLELSHGETSLIDSTPPLRTVNVVAVRILGADGRILIESRQEMSDGTVRERGRPLSEKMRPGETVDVAVMRAVKEELGSDVVEIVPGSYVKKVEERVSASYPGLPASYVLHCVDAWVEGLPDREDFCTEEECEYGECIEGATVAEKAVSVKKHFWKWVVLPDSD